MRKSFHNSVATALRRLTPELARGLWRRQDGAAAVEFALIATPFLALIFAIIESALVFFAGQSLETTVAAASRQIMTGQAMTTAQHTGGTIPWSAADFKSAVCAQLSTMFDCSKLYVSAQTYTDFASANTSTPVQNGQVTVDYNNLPFNTGGPGSIVVVQLYYQWPIYVSLLSNNLANVGTDRLLVATSVFMNEPYQ